MTGGNGIELSNPYLHMTKSQLLRRHKQIERNLRKIASGRGKKLDFDLNRLTFLTISEALQDKNQVDELTELFNLTAEDPKENSSGGTED